MHNMLNDNSPYSRYPKIRVAVDCVIFTLSEGSLKLLLTLRAFEPERGKWSLMGGFVDRGESAEDAARRVLRNLTGIDNIILDQVGAFSDIGRDPGERVISIAYTALLAEHEYDAERLILNKARWFDIDSLPALGFDHPKMVEQALELLKSNIYRRSTCFRLLPELFTLAQLQRVYESVLGHELDKRNFRKRILELPYIEETDQIDKKTSRRGARLYRFDIDEYRRYKEAH